MSDWRKEAVVYQIYPRCFNDSDGDGMGDLNGILQKLPYLSNLGVDVIWLSPIYASPEVDNGYDISDYRAINPRFGTMADFDRLLAEAHRLGLKIVMDLVVNHTSDEHEWFKESAKSKHGPYADYYIWRDEPNNWGASFGGSCWKYVPERGQYYFHSFHEKQPDLNWDNPAVRQDVYAMMRFWCDKGIDGFRMDVINFISKSGDWSDGEVDKTGFSPVFGHIVNGPRVHEYLQEMNREVLSRYDLITVGEAPGVSPEEARQYAGFTSGELNMVFQFEHMGLEEDKIDKWAKKPPKLTALKSCLSKWQTALYGKAWNSLYWDNHDQPRAVSRFGDDQKYRVQSAKMLGVCLHFMQGTPYVYQGEELGMTNAGYTDISQYSDVESLNAYRDLVGNGILTKEDMLERLAFTSRDNARTPIPWDEAEKQTGDPDSVYTFYKRLIALRKQQDIIIEGEYELLLPESEELFIYTRTYKNKRLLVICNFSGEEQRYTPDDIFKNGKILISNYNRNCYSEALAPYEAIVLLVEYEDGYGCV